MANILSYNEFCDLYEGIVRKVLKTKIGKAAAAVGAGALLMKRKHKKTNIEDIKKTKVAKAAKAAKAAKKAVAKKEIIKKTIKTGKTVQKIKHKT